MKKIIYAIIIFIFSLYLIGCSTNDIINDPNIDDKEEVNEFDELYSFNQILNILEEVDVNEYDNIVSLYQTKLNEITQICFEGKLVSGQLTQTIDIDIDKTDINDIKYSNTTIYENDISSKYYKQGFLYSINNEKLISKEEVEASIFLDEVVITPYNLIEPLNEDDYISIVVDDLNNIIIDINNNTLLKRFVFKNDLLVYVAKKYELLDECYVYEYLIEYNKCEISYPDFDNLELNKEELDYKNIYSFYNDLEDVEKQEDFLLGEFLNSYKNFVKNNKYYQMYCKLGEISIYDSYYKLIFDNTDDLQIYYASSIANKKTELYYKDNQVYSIFDDEENNYESSDEIMIENYGNIIFNLLSYCDSEIVEIFKDKYENIIIYCNNSNIEYRFVFEDNILVYMTSKFNIFEEIITYDYYFMYNYRKIEFPNENISNN